MISRYRVAVAVATLVALASVWHIGHHAWHRLGVDRSLYVDWTTADRLHAPIHDTGLPPDVFDWFGRYLAPGDRVYFQVLPGGYSEFADLPTIVEEIADYYLLPAVQVSNLRDATVVVSWQEDPSQLHVHFITQVRAGLQLFFVSRIKTP